MDEILDLETKPSISLDAQNKKLLIWVGGLTVISIILFSIIPLDNRGVGERFVVALPGIIILLVIVGFPLGLLVSLIPYKNLSFGKKYLRSSLLVMLVTQIIMCAMMIISASFYFLPSK